MQELHSTIMNTEHSIVAHPARKRRRWSTAEKQAILSQIGQNAMTTSSVARKYGISLRLLFAWKRQAHKSPPAKSTQDVNKAWELFQLNRRIHEVGPSVEPQT